MRKETVGFVVLFTYEDNLLGLNYCLQLPPWCHVCLRIEFGALISCICVLRQWNKRARGMRASWLLDMTYILELHRSYKSKQPTPMVAWFVDISNQSMNLRLGFLHQMCPHPRPSPFLCHVHACTCGEEEDKGYALTHGYNSPLLEHQSIRQWDVVGMVMVMDSLGCPYLCTTAFVIR